MHYYPALFPRHDLLVPDLRSAPDHVNPALPYKPALPSVFGLWICLLPVWTPSPETPALSRTRMCSLTRLLDCHLFGISNVVITALSCSGLGLGCFWIRSHTLYNQFVYKLPYSLTS